MKSFVVLFLFFSISFISYSQTKQENIKKLLVLMNSEESTMKLLNMSLEASKLKLLKDLENKVDQKKIDSLMVIMKNR